MIYLNLYTHSGTKIITGFMNEAQAVRYALDYISKNGLCHYTIEAK